MGRGENASESLMLGRASRGPNPPEEVTIEGNFAIRDDVLNVALHFKKKLTQDELRLIKERVGRSLGVAPEKSYWISNQTLLLEGEGDALLSPSGIALLEQAKAPSWWAKWFRVREVGASEITLEEIKP